MVGVRLADSSRATLLCFKWYSPKQHSNYLALPSNLHVKHFLSVQCQATSPSTAPTMFRRSVIRAARPVVRQVSLSHRPPTYQTAYKR